MSWEQLGFCCNILVEIRNPKNRDCVHGEPTQEQGIYVTLILGDIFLSYVFISFVNIQPVPNKCASTQCFLQLAMQNAPQSAC